MAPTQPMLTDRAPLRLKQSYGTALPTSLQASPERDGILLFAQLQKSPGDDTDSTPEATQELNDDATNTVAAATVGASFGNK